MSKCKEVATLRTNARPCSFCKECDDVEVLFGLFYNIGKINVHHFCLLLSTTLLQKGRDDEGVLGFLHEDIINELKRAHKRKCCYCGQWCPTLRCDQPGCGRLFHLPCGRRNGALNLFHDRFQSYCAQHRPIQRVPAGIITGRGRGASGSAVIKLERLRMSRDGTRLDRPRDVPDIGNLHIGPQSRALIENAELKNEVSVVTLESGKAAEAAEWHTCGICYDRVTPLPTAHTLWPPCCKGDKWFHRICVARLALSAGRHYVKCPLCNNQPVFLDALYKYGFYVPDQDASWEREAGAFRELHERPKECYVPHCLHQAGRDKAGSKRWQLVICSLCGSQAAHRACADISVNRTLICSRCRPDVPRDEYSESHNDCESISVVSNLEKITSVKSRCDSVTSVCDSGVTSGRHDDCPKSDNNYLGNENLHLMDNDDGLSKNDSITSWRNSILASMSQASTSKQDGYNHLTENLNVDDFVVNKSDNYFTPSLEYGIDNMSRTYSIDNEILHVNDVILNSDKAFNVKSQIKTKVVTQKKKIPAPRRSFRMSLLTYNKGDPGPQTNEDCYLVKNNYILRKRSSSVFPPTESSAKPSKRSRGAAVTYSTTDDLNIAALQCLAKEAIMCNENSTPVSNELPIVEECVVSAREVSDSTLANSKPKAVNLLRGSGSQKILRVKISPKSRSHAAQAKSAETVNLSRVKETFKGKLGKYFEHLEELKKKRKIMDEKKDSPERAVCSLPTLTVKPCPKSKKSFYIENGDTISLEDKMDEEEQATVKYKIINNDFAKVITSRRVYTIAIPNSHRVKNKKRKSAEIGQTDITSYFRTLDTKVESGRGDVKSAGVTVDENVGDSSGVALVTDKSSDVTAENNCSGVNVNEGSLKMDKKRKSRKRSNKKRKSNINKLKIKDKSHVSSASASDLVNGDCDVLIGDVLSDCDVTKSDENDESKGISLNDTEINEVIDANNCGGCNNEIIDSTLSDCILLDNDNDTEDDPTAKTSEDGDMTTRTNDTKSIICVNLDEIDEITSDEIIDGSKSGDGHLKENIIDSDCEIISSLEEAVDSDSMRAVSAAKPVEVEKEKSVFGDCITDSVIDSLVNVPVIKTDNEEMAADNGLRSNKSRPPSNEISLHYRRNTKRVIKYNYSSPIKVDMDDVKDCDVVVIDNDGILSGKDISIKKENFKNSIVTHYIDLVDRKRQNDNCTIVDDHKPSASTHKCYTALRDADRKHKINSEPFNCVHKAAEHVGVQNFNFMITECDVSHAKRRKQQRPEDDVKPEFVKNRTITDFFSPVAAVGVSTGESSFNRQKFNKDFWMSGSDYLKTIRSDIKNRRMDMSNRYKRSKNRYN